MNDIIDILNINSTEFQNSTTVLVKAAIILCSLLKNGALRIYKFYGRKLGFGKVI